MIIEITLISFLLGTSMEETVFENAKGLLENARELADKKENNFHFKNKNFEEKSIIYVNKN